MKKYIPYCILLITIFTNQLQSQDLILKYENKYGIVAFKRNDNRFNYKFYYGICYLNKNATSIAEYFVPPIFDHVTMYVESSNINMPGNNLNLIDFEIKEKWYRRVLINSLTSELEKILGMPVFDYYYFINLENDNKNSTYSLWNDYWNKIVSNNKDLFANKGEFEKLANFESRKNLQKELKLNSYVEFRKNITEIELSEKAKKEESKRAIISQSLKRAEFKIKEISDYDAESETFSITITSKDKEVYDQFLKIKIPIDEAQEFKVNFRKIEMYGYQLLNEDLKVKIVNLTATLNDRQYQIGKREDLSKYNASLVNSSSIVTAKITSLPKLISTIQFNDDNGNNFLDGDEKSNIKIVVRNDGDGLAQGVNIKAQVDNTTSIEFKSDNYIGQIEPKSEKSVTIPVRALENINSGNRNFKILINEANGFNPSPIELVISTKELIKPSLKLSEVGIENTISKLPILKQSETSKVIFRVQNDSRADAKNLIFNLQLPINVLLLNGNKRIEIAELKAGSIIDIPIDIAPNNLANSSEEFKLTYAGKYLNGSFSKNLSIESNAVANNKVVISGKEESGSNYNEVITADLNIDIENNIPLNKNINKNAIAVVLGIEKYRNVGNVSFASRDASIVKEYFNKSLGIPLENIYFKVNGEVTKGEMEKIFGGWLQNRVDENTSVYVYYAGHGAPSSDQNAYLIPNDGDPNYAEVTGYSLNKMYDQLGKLPTDNITVFLDACFSGQDREQKLLIKDARGLGIKTKTSSIPDKLNVFSASSNDQVSSGWPDKKHGLFTYFMLKGIQGSADKNNDKQVSYEELSNYIKLNVERQAGFLDRKQNPQSKIVNLLSNIN
jgi:hypothetical protein